jgi:hypothetical protein
VALFELAGAPELRQGGQAIAPRTRDQNGSEEQRAVIGEPVGQRRERHQDLGNYAETLHYRSPD